jgi:hypothetical protein
MQRVLRWDVPVDDQWHEIGAGYVAHVAARTHRERHGDLVEVWTVEDVADTQVSVVVPMRSVAVVGTGHQVPDNAEHIGSAVVPAFHVVSGPTRGTVEHIESTAGLVWHLFAKYDPAEERQQLMEEAQRLAALREDLIAQGADDIAAHLVPIDSGAYPRAQVERVRDVLRMPIYQRGTDTNPMVTIEAILWALDGTADVSSYVTGTQVGARTPTSLGNERHGGTVRSARVHTLEDEATGLAYWIAHELGEHVDDLDGETLTQSVRRLLAVKLAPPHADAVPIADWSDFQVGYVVVQNPAAPGADEGGDFLVRRPGAPS